jgi:uncharacterized membrane protein
MKNKNLKQESAHSYSNKSKENNKMQSNKHVQNNRRILYFALLGIMLSYVWFFRSSMQGCIGISCQLTKAYLIMFGLFLLVVDLAILIFYEKKHKFSDEPRNRQWIYLLIVILLILIPIVSIFVFWNRR